MKKFMCLVVTLFGFATQAVAVDNTAGAVKGQAVQVQKTPEKAKVPANGVKNAQPKKKLVKKAQSKKPSKGLKLSPRPKVQQGFVKAPVNPSVLAAFGPSSGVPAIQPESAVVATKTLPASAVPATSQLSASAVPTTSIIPASAVVVAGPLPASAVQVINVLPASAVVVAKPIEKSTQKSPEVLSSLNNEVEIGTFSGGVSFAASPITSVDLRGDKGLDIRYVGSIAGMPNTRFTLGGSRRAYDVSLAGTSLGGGPNSKTISGTLRYVFPMSQKYVAPYMGVGLYNTTFPETLLMGGALRMTGSSVSGAVIEAGTKFTIIKKGFSVGLKGSYYMGSTGFTRLETAVGNALLTNINIKNRSEIGVAISVPFY